MLTNWTNSSQNKAGQAFLPARTQTPQTLCRKITFYVRGAFAVRDGK